MPDVGDNAYFWSVMSKSQNSESKLHRILRMTVIVDKSFEQLFTIRFTPLGLAVVVGALAVSLVAGVTVLIAFTGLREYIPGYPTGEERLMIVSNLMRADSLANEVALRDNMLRNLRLVLRGDDLPQDADAQGDGASRPQVTRESLASLNRAKSEEETAFLNGMESEDKYDVSTNGTADGAADDALEATFFFSPLKGVVTDRFGTREGHLGVDIAAGEGTPVMSTLAGTVFFAEWSVATGYVVAVQHDNQLVSVYKHNGRLLKGQGERVKAGEAIAIIGNSGELTSGTHLHFELWHRGAPLNPENYIEFEAASGDD